MVILDSSTNNRNFSLPNLNPGNRAIITNGIKISINITKVKTIKNNKEKILRAKTKARAFLLLSFSFLTNIGTKEELKAPSANTLRKKFGNLKAAKNTSDKKLTPINLAIIISLINPKIRDIEIKNAMIKADLKRVIGD